MILVTVGTSETPFDRLLQALDGAGHGDEELLVQHGPSHVRPAGATYVDYLPYDQLVAAIERSRLLVTHAGVGTIMTALGAGKRPVVVPRLHRLGEAVDDHQLELGRRLSDIGLVVLVEDVAELPARLEATPEALRVDAGPSRELVAELKRFVAEHRRPRSPSSA